MSTLSLTGLTRVGIFTVATGPHAVSSDLTSQYKQVNVRSTALSLVFIVTLTYMLGKVKSVLTGLVCCGCFPRPSRPSRTCSSSPLTSGTE